MVALVNFLRQLLSFAVTKPVDLQLTHSALLSSALTTLGVVVFSCFRFRRLFLWSSTSSSDISLDHSAPSCSTTAAPTARSLWTSSSTHALPTPTKQPVFVFPSKFILRDLVAVVEPVFKCKINPYEKEAEATARKWMHSYVSLYNRAPWTSSPFYKFLTEQARTAKNALTNS